MKPANANQPRPGPAVKKRQGPFKSKSHSRTMEYLNSEDRHEVEAEARKIMIDIGDQLTALCSCGVQDTNYHFEDAVDLAMRVLVEGLRSYNSFCPDNVSPSEWSWEADVLEQTLKSRDGKSWRETCQTLASDEFSFEWNVSQLAGYAYWGRGTMLRIDGPEKMEDPAIMIDATEAALRACVRVDRTPRPSSESSSLPRRVWLSTKGAT